MKKIQQEELVSKSIIFTAIILVVMFYATLVQNGAFKIPPTALSLMTSKIVVGISILFLLIAVIFVVLGFRKNQKYFEISAWSAAIATFSMLLEINYFVKALEFKLPSNFFVLPNVTIKFYAVAMALFVVSIIFVWIKTIVKLIKG